MPDSISFDRAASFYDATRALPDAVAAKLTDALLAERDAVQADSVLEVGVGTGRISRPLAKRGVRIRGVDIAPLMLAKLREQVGPNDERPDLVLADATLLPFAPDSFRMALMLHVLHLVSDWRQSIEELVRVLEPRGVFVHVISPYPGDNPWTASKALWDDVLAGKDFTPRPRPAPEEIQEALRSLGGSVRVVEFARLDDRMTPGDNLELMRQRIHSWTWEYPDDLFWECFAEFEPRYRAHYREMDRELVNTVIYELEVWSFR